MSKKKVATKKADNGVQPFNVVGIDRYSLSSTIPYIGISKESRKALKVECNQAVRVSNHATEQSVVALVGKIRREFVPYVFVCQGNSVLGEKLNLVRGSQVTINTKVAKKEAEALREPILAPEAELVEEIEEETENI